MLQLQWVLTFKARSHRRTETIYSSIRFSSVAESETLKHVTTGRLRLSSRHTVQHCQPTLSAVKHDGRHDGRPTWRSAVMSARHVLPCVTAFNPTYVCYYRPSVRVQYSSPMWKHDNCFNIIAKQTITIAVLSSRERQYCPTRSKSASVHFAL